MNMQDIAYYEAMGKLALLPEERAWALERASMLEESFEALSSVGTEGVEPLVTVLALENVLREDIAAQMLPREEILAAAPEQYDGYFQAPKTLE